MPLRSDISAGWGELRRYFQRLALNRELRRHAEEREVALQALGEKAWEQKADLAGFGDLRGRLEGATARSGELAATAQQLEARKAALEAERKEALEKFQARRRAVEEVKRPVDASLKAARDKHRAAEQALAQARSRHSAIAAELATLERDAAAPAEDRRAQLRTEQGVVATAQTAAQAELPALAAEAARLKSQADTHVAELAAIQAEEKAILARIDGELARVRSEANAAAQQQRAVGTERAGLFRELGRGVYDSGARTAGLEEPSQRVRGIDAARAATDARLGGSLAETQAMPAGTMGRFWGMVAGCVVLVGALIGGGTLLAQREAPQVATVTVSVPGLDPEDERDMAVMRFVGMPKEISAKERAAAVEVLKDDIRTMGATADPAHLPVLIKLLRSDVPELRLAAADAIGMIRPTAVETADLLKLAQDPSAPVANAARRALGASSDPAAREAAAKSK